MIFWKKEKKQQFDVWEFFLMYFSQTKNVCYTFLIRMFFLQDRKIVFLLS